MDWSLNQHETLLLTCSRYCSYLPSFLGTAIVSSHITDFTMFMTTRNENLVVIILHCYFGSPEGLKASLTSLPASWKRELRLSDRRNKLGLPAVPCRCGRYQWHPASKRHDGISNETYTHPRLAAALGLCRWSYRFQPVGSIVNVTFAIDSDFDAGRRRQGSH